MTKLSFFLAALVGSAIAAPSAPLVTEAPKADVENFERASSCTFSGANGAAQASKSQASWATIALNNVAVPSGQTLDLSKLKDGTRVVFKCTTTWGYKEWTGPLLKISGKKINIDGSGATLNADGARWWDGKGGKGGKKKPKFFAAHSLTDSTINNLYIKNTPVQAVSINRVNGLTINGMTIDDADGDSQGGHNTDGFDIGDSTGVTINGAKVYNQDDCVAINSGNDITFSGGLCSGGHGLSIGSVGNRANNVVDTVKFLNSQVTKSTQAIRVKTFKGTTGQVRRVTYSDITMSKISKYGILIEQNYDGGDLHGEPTSTLPITGLTLKNIYGQGAVNSKGTNIAIVCGSSGCSNWTWSNVKVSGGKNYSSCQNVPSVATCKA
ncbi:glycoside hydrolase [Dactylonectria macrodidyma]|uniref:endo-polygalacturonase n=1 Tax=Dactylonectria macrodidyma TaxID=307937 RepID=A0A9P9J2Q1_9HYPO|nr:glycoside hydrolase [Dactylonectria macrodidyma]